MTTMTLRSLLVLCATIAVLCPVCWARSAYVHVNRTDHIECGGSVFENKDITEDTGRSAMLMTRLIDVCYAEPSDEPRCQPSFACSNCYHFAFVRLAGALWPKIEACVFAVDRGLPCQPCADSIKCTHRCVKLESEAARDDCVRSSCCGLLVKCHLTFCVDVPNCVEAYNATEIVAEAFRTRCNGGESGCEATGLVDESWEAFRQRTYH